MALTLQVVETTQGTERHRLRFNEWMRLDLKYIDEWSIWLDLKIMLRTIPEVVRATGE